MKYNKWILALLASGLLLSGCGSTTSTSDDNTAEEASSVVSTTTITTTTGQVIQVDKTTNGLIFKGYENKIVLLEVYGDTCPHCIAAIPEYNKLQAKYPNDVTIIALESYGTLTNASQQNYLTVPKANSAELPSFIKDLTGYNQEAVPFLMILARDGSITYNQVLADFPADEIETRIEELL